MISPPDEPKGLGHIKRKLLAVFGFVIYANLFFFHRLGTTAFVFVTLGFFVFLVLLFWERVWEKHFTVTLVLFSAAIFLSSVLILARDQGFVQFVLVLFLCGLFMFFTYLASAGETFVERLFEFLVSPFLVLGSYLVACFRALDIGKILEDEHIAGIRGKWSKVVGSVIVGVLIGVPVVLIFISLFSQADPIFAWGVKNIFSHPFWQTILGRTIRTLILLLFLLPMAFFIRKKRSVLAPWLSLRSFPVEMTVVMSLVATVVGLFLWVQWAYLFAHVPTEPELAKFGVATYSEYVRKGFLELLVAAGMLYSLLWAGLITIRTATGSGKRLLTVAQGVVIVELAILILSNGRRIWLYQLFHGWSLIRIYGSFFLVWLAGLLAFLALRHVKMGRWVLAEVLFTVSIVVLIGTFNAEAFIASTNPPTVNGRVDYVYLSRMSADGFLGWSQALTHAKEILFTKQMTEKTFLNRDDRREIFYAGQIIHNLTQRYHDLLVRQGTTEEKVVYANGVLVYQKQEQEDALNRVTTALAVDDGNNSRYYQNSGQGISTEIRAINEAITKIASEPDRVVQSLRVETYGAPYTYSSGPLAADVVYSFYQTNWDKDAKAPDALDRLYVWHWAQANAYAKFKDVVSIEDFLTMQRNYFDLREKISHQTENERDFDHDVSFATPLL